MLKEEKYILYLFGRLPKYIIGDISALMKGIQMNESLILFNHC